MAFLSIPNVSVRGISACVPQRVEDNISLDIYKTKEEAEKVIATTGVEHRHLVDGWGGVTASDLCFCAAKRLIRELGWETDSIDAVVYVTQTPDYVNQPDAFIIHERLQLKESCFCMNIFHGCPGWIVGLSTITSLMSHSDIKRALLLDGDCVTYRKFKKDSESRPLFGDAGSCTALEIDTNASPLLFEMGSRSNDGKSLINKDNGARYPFTQESFKRYYELVHGLTETIDGQDSVMDGMSVFSFGISEPPKSINRLCDHFGINLNSVDEVMLHQANAFILKKIIKKLKIDPEKVPMSLRDYGNTTSVSIPLTIVSQRANEYHSQKVSTICSAFGTGLSWATCYMETNKIVCPDVIIYNNEENYD